MNPITISHRWDVTPQEAIEIQQKLRSQVAIEKLQTPIRFAAGADISFDKGSDVVYAGVVVLQLPELTEVARATAVTTAKFPYIPGLLSFRESPPVLEAWAKLKTLPDVLMIDGQGLAHPRRFGIACHIGVLLNVPTIGCAKSLLVGRYEEPATPGGSYSPLMDRGEQVGVALRTRDDVSPIFVSIGHKVMLEDAVRLAMQCTHGYRIPEPTRQAHLLVNALRRGENVSQTLPQQESLF
jgi:deoxyribonuclease V